MGMLHFAYPFTSCGHFGCLCFGAIMNNVARSMCTSFCVDIFSVLLHIHVGLGWVGHMINLFNIL